MISLVDPPRRRGGSFAGRAGRPRTRGMMSMPDAMAARRGTIRLRAESPSSWERVVRRRGPGSSGPGTDPGEMAGQGARLEGIVEAFVGRDEDAVELHGE